MKALQSYLYRVLKATCPKTMRQFRMGRYVSRWCCPDPIPDCVPETPAGYIDCEGLELDVESQLARVRSWKDKGYCELYERLRRDKLINIREPQDTDLVEDKVANGFYPTPDAECYASMIMDFKPSRIVEVGCGYSTRVARRTIEFGNLSTRLISIDPQPRADVADLVDERHAVRLEDLDISQIKIDADTMLFIDSSHICRPRGDVAILYCKIIPALPRGVVVHAHDVYTPYDYPTIYDDRLWNEQYLLQTLLTYSTKFEVLLANHLLCREHGDLVRDVISPHIDSVNNQFCGASFWFRAAT